ncbi:MAG: nucleotidyl transferase AbiEii/AbiGii toxin family protein [Bacteroidales bacterium]
MLDLKVIEQYFPQYLRVYKRNILREYLQYKILDIIFSSEYGTKLIFMGGTAIRIVYDNTRFSEDLDFDNKGLSKDSFKDLSEIIRQKLLLEGYKVEVKVSFKEAYHIYIKFSEIFYELNIRPNPDEKLVLYIDAEAQNYVYKPDKKLINKFNYFMYVNVVPSDILLSQKICAVFTRKRPQGRDFYDIVFLSGFVKPSIEYLKKKLNIKDYSELKTKLLEKCALLNFKQLAKDVEAFLFNPSDSKKVLFFMDFVKKKDF